jgi:murein DD-endopeptidase MepM/ murein hydrolase activator NlpD
MGHAIGLHAYLRSADDTAATLQWLALKRELGGLWLVTEYAFYVDAYHGWRTQLSPWQYGAFLDKTLPLFQREQMPVLLFSGDNWPMNAQGQATGFGVLDSADMLTELARVNRSYKWNGLTVTPTEPNIPAAPGTATVKRVHATTLGLRTDHNTSAALIRRLDNDEQVAVYLDTATGLINGYSWVYIETSRDKGWAAIRGSWGESFVSVDEPQFKLIRPVACATIISSKFGVPRDYDGDGVLDDRHEGLDLTHAHADCTPLVLAGADGVVDAVSTVGDYGLHVKLMHVIGGETFITWYCHLQKILVTQGQMVSAGDFIGVMGSTGHSTGMHLHLNVQHIGHGMSGFVIPDAVNPELYLAA